jgi:hypothetical protein
VAKVLAETDGNPIDDQYFLMKHHLDLDKNYVDFKKTVPRSPTIKPSGSRPRVKYSLLRQIDRCTTTIKQKMRIPIKRFLSRIADWLLTGAKMHVPAGCFLDKSEIAA